MPQVQLTEITIRNLPTPDKGQRMYFDRSMAGFGVRVSQGGTKTFALMTGARRQLRTIGRVGVVSLAQARQRAREMLAEQTLGLTQEYKPVLYSKALEQFLKAYKAKNKPSTAEETERLIRRHLMFDKAVHEISTTDITDIIDRLFATPSEQQHLFVAARHLFHWFQRRRFIELSPLAGIEAPHRPKPRERVLDVGELTAIYNAQHDTYGDILRTLILTGQRVGQVTKLRPEYVDANARTMSWPANTMKANRPHTIPYSPMVAAIIEPRLHDGFVFHSKGNPGKPFNNFSNSKRQLDKDLSLPHWTLHDLRRSATTQWAALGVAPHICERILAHTTGEISGVAAIYNRHSYMDEMRQAFDLFDNHLAKLINN